MIEYLKQYNWPYILLGVIIAIVVGLNFGWVMAVMYFVFWLFVSVVRD